MPAELFAASRALASGLSALSLPLYDGSKRLVTADAACSLSLEHWNATLHLLQEGFLPSAAVVHRAQFEAVLRSIWVLYAAMDAQVDKLVANLDDQAEQGAKNLPQTAEMLAAIEKKGPPQAFGALAKFKSNSWGALNSYAHAGIHPIRRLADGYPGPLIDGLARNANGLGVLASMQAAALSGAQWLQAEILALADKHAACMPPVG